MVIMFGCKHYRMADDELTNLSVHVRYSDMSIALLAYEEAIQVCMSTSLVDVVQYWKVMLLYITENKKPLVTGFGR